MERCKIGWVIAPAPLESECRWGRKGKEKTKPNPEKPQR